MQSGDSLSAIAARNNMSLSTLLANNPQFASNPNMIKPGQSVNLGGGSSGGGSSPAPKNTPAIPNVASISSPSDVSRNNNQSFGLPEEAAPPANIFRDKAIDTPQYNREERRADDSGDRDQELYDEELRKYQQDLQLTPEEEQLEKDRAALDESYRKAYTNTAGQPIPLEFITGQQRRLQESQADLARPLADRAALLQAKRTATLDSKKFALEALERKLGIKREAAKPIQLSKGETLYDPVGKKPIYSAPEEKNYSGAVGEYQFYADQEAKAGRQPMGFSEYQTLDANRKAKALGVGSGSGGSALAQAIMQNPGMFAGLTPSAKTAIIPELVRMGFQPPANLSSAQQDDISTMDTVSNLAAQLLQLGDDLPGVGAFGQGSIGSALSKIGVGSAEGQHVRNLVGNIQGTIAKLRGGTSFTPNEQALLERYTPTVNDADWQIKQKLIDLNQYINSKKQNLLNATTITASGGQAGGSGGNAADPLGLFN